MKNPFEENPWGDNPHPRPTDAPATADIKPTLTATPLRKRDLKNIPPRQWLYGRELVQGFVSVLGSPGGTGKTAYVVTVALSVVLGRSLLSADPRRPDPHKAVYKRCRAWIYNLEDPADEMDRRILAAMMHYKIDFEDIADDIFTDSGRDRPLVVTRRIEGALVRAPIIDALVEELLERGIKLLIIDPFVQSHTGEENRNEEMNLVMAAWGEVAARTGCAIWLVHHFRKGGQSGDAESFRGAAAIQGAARVMSTLATMSLEDAGKLGVEDQDRWQYVRRDNAKANMAPKPTEAEWCKLVSVNLGNGTEEYPQGDAVQVVEVWSPPSPWDGIPWSLIVRMLGDIEEGPSPGEFYAAAKQSKDRWAGNVVMARAGRTEGQAAIIIKAWTDNGVLESGSYKSPSRKNAETACVRVIPDKVQEMKRLIEGGPDYAA